MDRSIPSDVLLYIFDYLGLSHLILLSRTGRWMHTIVIQSSTYKKYISMMEQPLSSLPYHPVEMAVASVDENKSVDKVTRACILTCDDKWFDYWWKSFFSKGGKCSRYHRMATYFTIHRYTSNPNLDYCRELKRKMDDYRKDDSWVHYRMVISACLVSGKRSLLDDFVKKNNLHRHPMLVTIPAAMGDLNRAINRMEKFCNDASDCDGSDMVAITQTLQVALMTRQFKVVHYILDHHFELLHDLKYWDKDDRLAIEEPYGSNNMGNMYVKMEIVLDCLLPQLGDAEMVYTLAKKEIAPMFWVAKWCVKNLSYDHWIFEKIDGIEYLDEHDRRRMGVDWYYLLEMIDIDMNLDSHPEYRKPLQDAATVCIEQIHARGDITELSSTKWGIGLFIHPLHQHGLSLIVKYTGRTWNDMFLSVCSLTVKNTSALSYCWYNSEKTQTLLDEAMKLNPSFNVSTFLKEKKMELQDGYLFKKE